MTEGKGAAHALYEAYQALLKSQDVDFERADDGFLMLGGDAEIGRCAGYLSIDDVSASADGLDADGVIVQVAFVMPEDVFEPVPSEDRMACYELIAYLAPDLPIGGFELDPDDGRLRFRMSQVWPALTIPPALMLAPMIESVAAIDDHADLFTKVLSREYEPAHAYVEKALADLSAAEQRPDEAERVRLLGILEVATARYRARDDKARLDRLAELVRDLSAA